MLIKSKLEIVIMFPAYCPKNLLVLISLLFRIIKLIDSASNPNISPGSFCYDDPSCGQSTWGGVCNTGAEQSPINIELKPFHPQIAINTKFFLNEPYAKEQAHKFYAQNNGHTAQFEFSPNTAALTSNLQISGGKLPATYNFAQLHFHWGENDSSGSEHRINGESYPLEMHMVHYKSIYSSLADALSNRNTDREAVAVMAIFFKISLIPNKALSSIITSLDSLQNPGKVTEFDLSLRISDLYPKKMVFARYLGSLTTPTCDEKMRTFRRLSNEEGNSDFNFRSTQPLYGRKVEFLKAPDFIFERKLYSIVPFGSFIFSIISQIMEGLFNYLRKYFVIL